MLATTMRAGSPAHRSLAFASLRRAYPNRTTILSPRCKNHCNHTDSRSDFVYHSLPYRFFTSSTMRRTPTQPPKSSSSSSSSSSANTTTGSSQAASDVGVAATRMTRKRQPKQSSSETSGSTLGQPAPGISSAAAGAKRDTPVVDQASEAVYEDGTGRETVTAVKSRSGPQSAKGNRWVDHSFDSQNEHCTPDTPLFLLVQTVWP